MSARVDTVRAPELLGCHVRGRAKHRRVAREHAAPALVFHLRDAEVEHLDALPAFGQRCEKEVRGLEVAMHDAKCMGLRDGEHRLEHVAHGFMRRHAPASKHDLVEIFALEELHRHELRGTSSLRECELEALVDRNDVLALDSRERFRLVVEALPRHRVGRYRALEYFDRHPTAQRLVCGLVHDPHAALSEHASDAILLFKKEARWQA